MIFAEHIQKVCNVYGIGKSLSFEFINEGVLNKNFILTTNTGKYFLKSVRDKKKDKLEMIHGVEKFMESHGIPAICMIRTNSGSISVQSDNDTFTLYPFIESDRKHKYSEEDCFNIGKMLANIHVVGSMSEAKLVELKEFSAKSKDEFIKKLHEFREKILSKSNQDKTDLLFIEYIDLKLKLSTHVHDQSLTNDTLTHGDYLVGNLLIDKESRKIIGVCDWEKSEFAPKARELARAILSIAFSVEMHWEKPLSAAQAFINGYKTTAEIDKENLIFGLKQRAYENTLSIWIENMHYNLGDSRANKFIESEMRLINSLVNDKLIDDIAALL